MLNKLPAAERLAALRSGYQLYQEKATGIYFLTAYGDPPRPYPECGGSLERSKAPRASLTDLKNAIAQAAEPFNIAKDEIDFKLVDQAVALAGTLEQPVLVCEVTDDGFGLAVQAAHGDVQYLRFMTCLGAATEDERSVQAVYRQGRGLAIADNQSEEFGGVAQSAIEDIFGVPGLSLYEHTEAAPAKGAFRRIGKAAPQLTVVEKLTRPFVALGRRAATPVQAIGLMLLVKHHARQPGKGIPDFTALQLFTVGALVLAVRVAIVVLTLYLLYLLLGF